MNPNTAMPVCFVWIGLHGQAVLFKVAQVAKVAIELLRMIILHGTGAGAVLLGGWTKCVDCGAECGVQKAGPAAARRLVREC